MAQKRSYVLANRLKRRLKETYESYLTGKVDEASLDQKLPFYLGILSHANQYTLATGLKNAYWVVFAGGRNGTLCGRGCAGTGCSNWNN